jgi:hypothetical protein
VLRAHSRLLRRNDDGCLDAFKIAHGHVGVRVFAFEILRGFDGQLPLVIVGPRLAVDRDLSARAGVLLHQPMSPARSSSRIARAPPTEAALPCSMMTCVTVVDAHRMLACIWRLRPGAGKRR